MTLIDYLQHYDAQNVIAFVALVLAYLAYKKSIIDEYKSWLDLSKSFQRELNIAKEWIGSSYKDNILPKWDDPSKFVYPLTSEAAKAMIWKGHPPKNIFSEKFIDSLSWYNERIQAFNFILMQQGQNYVVNQSKKKASDKSIWINNVIHNDLIGSDKEWHLNHLYHYLECELKTISERGLSNIPWYLKYSNIILSISVFVFLTLDFYIP